MFKIFKSQLGLALIIIVLIVVGALLLGVGTIYLYQQSTKVEPEPETTQPPITRPETPPDTGVWVPEEGEIIRVLFPKGGEKLEIGKTYEIRWENYIGNEPLTIALQVTTPDGKVYTKTIADNVPGTTEGIYNWTVTSEPADSKYKIEVYPPANRPLVGRSKDFFSITGDSLIMVNTPQPLEKVTSPIKITGKARRIFSEGEFIIRLREVGAKWDEDKGIFVKFPPIAEAIAWPKTGDWMSGDWCDFEVELPFPLEKIRGLAMIEFYKRDERFGEKLIYKFPVSPSEQISMGLVSYKSF
jgi:hypothetical protein